MTGTEIKKAIFSAGLRCWEVADKIGISDGNFSRKLRKPLNEADTKRVLKAIDELKAEKALAEHVWTKSIKTTAL